MPNQQVVERSTDISAPPDVVWDVLEDVNLLPSFSPSTVSVEAPAALTDVGQEFTQTVRLAGKSFTSTWRVEEIRPARRLVIAGSVLPGTHYEMTESIEAHGDGTRFTLQMRYRLPFGPIGRLAAKLGAERRAVEEAELVIDGVRKAAEERAAAARTTDA